jgi:hypothetical protein
VGGFLAVAIVVAVLVAAVVEAPRGPTARLLALPPLPYIGKISYGLYLWHWPVLLTLTAGRTGLHGPSLLVARIAVTATVTMLSFHLVEDPIRRGHLRLPRPGVTAPAAVGAVIVLALLATAQPPHSVRSAADLEGLARRVQSPRQPAPTVAVDPVVGRPIRMLLAGDSLALTLGTSDFGKVAARNGVQMSDATMLGCGVARGMLRRTEGQAMPPTNGCDQWPDRIAARVRDVRPDVAGLLVGRWEVEDQLYNGSWAHVGQPDYDAYLLRELDLAINTLSAGGARVVLFTTPVFEPREAPDGSVYPETKPERVVRFNKILRVAAARHPGTAGVLDLAAVLTPGNRYTDRLGGRIVRDDGVHITAAGGGLVGDAVLPRIVNLVREDLRTNTTVGRSAPPA